MFDIEETSTPIGTQTLQVANQGDRMREWLDLFFQTAKAAEVLAKTDFVPKQMIGKPAQVAASMMKGYELNIDPLDALGNIYSVHGRIGFYAEFMRRRIIQDGHEIRIVDATDHRAVIEGRRAGTEEWQRASFTADQARKAGIDIAGYPEDKLVARATSRLCRRVFPDVLSGAAIVEDMVDGNNSATIPSERIESPALDPDKPRTAKRTTAPRKAAAKPKAAPAIEPAQEPEVAPAESADQAGMPPLPGESDFEVLDAEPAPEPEPAQEPAAGDVKAETKAAKPAATKDKKATEAQITKLHTTLTKAGITERDERQTFISARVGRHLESSKELTTGEAGAVIDFLENGEPVDTEPQS